MIKASYVNGPSLDSELVIGGAVNSMLEFAERPAYPFLTRLDQVVGRPPRHVPEEMQDLWRVWVLVRSTWPDLDPTLLSGAAIDGIMRSLGDSTSSYLTQEAYRRFLEEEPSRYDGIGTSLGVENGQLVIRSPMSGGPADRAGLQRGDVILAIDGSSIAGQTPDEATANIRGPAGTRVTFLIRRPTESDTREVSVTRTTIDIPTVDMSLLPGSIGYIHIEKFGDNTVGELLDGLENFNRLETLGVLLDLRNNAEGPLEVALNVGSQFLESGLFLYEVDNEKARKDHNVNEGGASTDVMVMVVLVNEGTGGAAEALAGALQDSGRAIVMGESTLGRGSTTTFHHLSNGDVLQFPVSYWYTPSGRSITDVGIKPDLEISLIDEEFQMNRDSQLISAYEYLDEQLPAFR